ncbi:MAG: hypothetical protein DHS20C15_06600 [Planctomycetota bacterium]|nr:MAG: hypothetical protein DHS20C15_06600 [Planctomycetota bacterium]
MKILLASVSFTTPYTFQQRFLALGYLHAIAVTDEVIGPRTDITHAYFDPSLHAPDELAAQMLEHEPDLVGLTCYVWNTHDVLRICECIKAQSPGTRILLGGPEVSYKYRSLLEAHHAIDWIAVNEGELTFRDLLRALLTGREGAERDVAGLAMRGPDGTPNLNAPRPFLKELDELPSPYLTGVLDVCEIRGGVTYQTARGCPFTCSYCDYGRNQPYYEFSLERVEAELALFKKQNARLLFNVDPTFNYSRKRAEAILQLLIKHDVKATHWLEVFPSLINEDLVELADRSHQTFVGVGIQSTKRETMNNIRRVWKPDKVAPMLDSLRGRPHIMLSYELIMGLPGDGLQGFLDTLSWTYEREPADIKSAALSILPRTPLEKEVDKWGIEYDSDIGHEILKTDFMNRDEVVVGKAVNDWHLMLQKAFALLRLLVKRPAGELIREWAVAAFAAGHHDRLHDLRTHRIEPQLADDLGNLWHGFVAEQCARAGVPDASAQFGDMVRYLLYRRARTWPSACFTDVRDIYFNEPYPELHRSERVTLDALSELDSLPEDSANDCPELGADIDRAPFSYDQRELYPLRDAAEIAAVPVRHREYVFFTTPDHGAGCAIEVDEACRSFLEFVDGASSVGQIAEKLTAQFGPEIGAHTPAIYEAFRRTGIFERPRFLPAGEGGQAIWQSCFPEHFRAMH